MMKMEWVVQERWEQRERRRIETALRGGIFQ
jgi:hypothetical protein